MGPIEMGILPALAICLGGDINNPLGLIAALLQRLRLLRAFNGPNRQRREVFDGLLPCRDQGQACQVQWIWI